MSLLDEVRPETDVEVYYSRPLFHLSRSTPLAGRALHRRLKALLRRFATYYPPPVSLSNLKRDALRPAPESILTDEIIERILTETCFVGDVMVTPAPGDEPMDGDSEDDDKALNRLAEIYALSSTATDLSFPITAPGDMGPGTLVIPGWIRERAAEVLFTDDISTESCSVTELVLQTLLKVGRCCTTMTPLMQVTNRPKIKYGIDHLAYRRDSFPARLYLASSNFAQKRSPPASVCFCLKDLRANKHPCTPDRRNTRMAKKRGESL